MRANGSFRTMKNLGDHANALIACQIQQNSLVLLGPTQMGMFLAPFADPWNEAQFCGMLPDCMRAPIRVKPQQFAHCLSFCAPPVSIPSAQNRFILGTPLRTPVLWPGNPIFELPDALPQIRSLQARL